MELVVKNLEGATVGTIQASDQVFAFPLKRPLVHQVMVAQLANRRVGTSKTKTRAEVAGGGRKPWRQKGTGRARQGSIRAPQWRHGGMVFALKPRDYRQRIPKEMRRQVINGLLSEKARQGALTVVDRFELAEAKAKEMKGVIQRLGIPDKCLIVTQGKQSGVVLAARNLPKVKTIPANMLNALDLLNYDHLLLSTEAVRKIEEHWAERRNRHKKASIDAESSGSPASEQR